MEGDASCPFFSTRLDNMFFLFFQETLPFPWLSLFLPSFSPSYSSIFPLFPLQALERKALPKRIRQEMKAREMMFRESMRISVTNLHEAMKPTEEKDRLKKVRTEGIEGGHRSLH